MISDKAIAWLLKFLFVILTILGRSNRQCCSIATALPHSLYKFNRTEFGFDPDSFEKRNVCGCCCSLYTFEEAVRITQCSYRPLPRSRLCGESLVKEIVSASGQCKFCPRKIYCYCPLASSLQSLVLRQGFIEQCESTRTSFLCTGLADVYDGDIWKEFQDIDGHPFLSAPNNYGLLLNIDWFQPFEHTVFSVGVVFLVLLNLPRSERFKRENVILYGVIPGPSEPSLMTIRILLL